VTVWAVSVVEEHPPAGVEPLEWLLLTTWAVPTGAAAMERVEWDGGRFGIEVWHKVLKSGCRIEARQLETAERLQRCLPLYSVIAWRILYAPPAQPPSARVALHEALGAGGMASALLRNPSHAHATVHTAHIAASRTLDCSLGRLSGATRRRRAGGDRVVERLSAFGRSHDYVWHYALALL